jgi:hypothetical protein
LSALSQCRSEPKDLLFLAGTTTNLNKEKNSVILSEASAKSARRFWRAETIQKRVEGPAFRGCQIASALGRMPLRRQNPPKPDTLSGFPEPK